MEAKKYYRIFELVDGVPTITQELNFDTNLFPFMLEDVEALLPKYVKEMYGENLIGFEEFLILPVYRIK